MKMENEFGIAALLEGLELGVEAAVESVVEHKRMAAEGSAVGCRDEGAQGCC